MLVLKGFITCIFNYWSFLLRHPHGILGHCAQNHHGRAIFFCFLLAPVLCLPAFFVFEIQDISEHNNTMYQLDASEDSKLYRLDDSYLIIVSYFYKYLFYSYLF